MTETHATTHHGEYHLTASALHELEQRVGRLSALPTDRAGGELQVELERFKSESLTAGLGVGVLRGIIGPDSDVQFATGAFVHVSSCLGELLPQNATGETVVAVADRGGTLARGARYHETRDGGSHHTDGVQLESPPDYVGLLCVRPSDEGGDSEFISVDAIASRLADHPGILRRLQEPFYIDRRGHHSAGNATSFEALLTSNGSGFSMRYLRAYVETGYALAAVPMTSAEIDALDAVDAILADPTAVHTVRLEAGDAVVFANRRLLHGRTPFPAADDPARGRLLLRAWVRSQPKANGR